MTPLEIISSAVGVIIGGVTPLILAYWRWVDKRETRHFREAEALQAAQWKQADIEHKRRMELAACSAAQSASQSVAEVRASKVERSAQVGEIKTLIEANTKISEVAFKEANGVNAKIASLGIEIAKQTAKANET